MPHDENFVYPSNPGKFTPLIDLCISNGMVPHSCFDPDHIPLAMQSSIGRDTSLRFHLAALRR